MISQSSNMDVSFVVKLMIYMDIIYNDYGKVRTFKLIFHF